MLIFRMFSSFGTVESHSRCYPWHCTFTEWCSRDVVRMMRGAVVVSLWHLVQWCGCFIGYWNGVTVAGLGKVEKPGFQYFIIMISIFILWCLRVLCLSTCPCMAVHTLTNVFYWKVSSAWGEARVPICINEEAERKPPTPQKEKKRKKELIFINKL